VDPEPRRAAWAGWTAPAAVRGLLPAGALTTPAEALQALLNTAIRRLTGRRVTVPRTGGLALRVEALEMNPDPLGVALGQFDDVQLVARDVEWRGWASDRVVVTFRNVHLRPLPTVAVVTAPVDVEIALPPALVAARLAAVRPGAVFEIEQGRDSADALLRWHARPNWGELVIAPEVTAAALHLRPVGARLGPLRCSLPGWILPLRIALPVLPRGLRLREINVGAGEVVLHLAADEWREPLAGTRIASITKWLERLA
jgi:hypothetical protein